ncbi:MAG: hypothetical protein DYG96_02375 [Chlorobi bacterium CHB2]|nr:hypothetical protein [Chlorobi bacterium CHB2]
MPTKTFTNQASFMTTSSCYNRQLGRSWLFSLLAIVGLLSASPLAAQTSRTAKDDPEESTTVGGYGEVHYVEPEGTGKGLVDVPRFIIFLEHYFAPEISFFSELEIEHTKIEGGEDGGEVALEQAYLQYNLSERAKIRAGLMVLPVGIVNEYHEPPTFNGVKRPRFDRNIIPSTWREIGVGVVGTVPEVEGLQYRAFLTSGLNAAGFSASSGIRGGRLAGAEARMDNLAFSGRAEYLTGGLKLGGSLYYGGSSAGNAALGDGLFDAPVTLYEMDAQFNVENLYLRGVIAGGSIDENINEVLHTKTVFDSTLQTNVKSYENPIGTAIGGGYIEAAYDVAKLINPSTSQQLLPFVRYESYNTMANAQAGVTLDKRRDVNFIIAGITFKPTYNTAFKLDWTIANDAADSKLPGELALAVGYHF